MNNRFNPKGAKTTPRVGSHAALGHDNHEQLPETARASPLPEGTDELAEVEQPERPQTELRGAADMTQVAGVDES